MMHAASRRRSTIRAHAGALLLLLALGAADCSGARVSQAGAASAPENAASPALAPTTGAGRATTPPPASLPLAQRMPLPRVLEDDGPPLPRHRDGLDGAWARVFLRANPGPFQYVAYEISARGGAAVASHLRGTMGRRDAVIRTELVERSLLQRVLERLEAIGAAQLEEAKGGAALPRDKQGARQMPGTSALPIFELTYRRGDIERTVVVVDPLGLDNGIYARFIAIVRGEVIAAVGDIGLLGPDASLGGSARGYLFIDSVPSADVYVDDEKLPERTPVLNWTLPPGVHRVRFRRDDLGIDRATTVRIEAGLTTSLELDLR